VPDVVNKLAKGYKANGREFKIHADGYNFLPYFKVKPKKLLAKKSSTLDKAAN
jgi:arylsulfatase